MIHHCASKPPGVALDGCLVERRSIDLHLNGWHIGDGRGGASMIARFIRRIVSGN